MGQIETWHGYGLHEGLMPRQILNHFTNLFQFVAFSEKAMLLPLGWKASHWFSYTGFYPTEKWFWRGSKWIFWQLFQNYSLNMTPIKPSPILISFFICISFLALWHFRQAARVSNITLSSRLSQWTWDKPQLHFKRQHLNWSSSCPITSRRRQLNNIRVAGAHRFNSTSQSKLYSTDYYLPFWRKKNNWKDFLFPLTFLFIFCSKTDWLSCSRIIGTKRRMCVSRSLGIIWGWHELSLSEWKFSVFSQTGLWLPSHASCFHGFPYFVPLVLHWFHFF